MNLTPEVIEKMIFVVLTAAVSIFSTWFLTRKKQTAEVFSLNAGTDKMFYGMAIEMQEKLPVWIERYEKESEEKMEMQGLFRVAEAEMKRLAKELSICRDDNARCKQVIEEARNVFTQFEQAMAEVAQHAPLLSELKEFKERLAQIQ